MRQCRVNHWMKVSGLVLLGSACGGLATSRPPWDEGLGPDVALEGSDCQGESCEQPPAAAPEEPPALPMAGRVCDQLDRGALDVSSQEEVDALAGCEHLLGSLTLRVFPGMDPTPLRSLRRVDGTLRVLAQREPSVRVLEALGALEEVNSLLLDGLSVPSLAGLSQLRRIGTDANFTDARGRIMIRNSSGLRNLEGLEALDTLEALELRDNAALTSLAGLASVRQLQRVYVANNPVQSLAGLVGIELQELTLIDTQLRDLSELGPAPRLQSLTLSANGQLSSLQGGQMPASLDTLVLTDLPLALDLTGLEGLREVGTLTIRNSGLTNVTALASLERVENLTLGSLPLLASLRGLESLREVTLLELDGLPQLVSLEGLSGLQSTWIFTIANSGLTSLAGLSSPTIQSFRIDQVGARSLTGLENVTAGGFSVSGAALESLSGLPRVLETGGLALQGLPALTDIEAVRGLTTLLALAVQDTALSNLDAFTDLRQVGELDVSRNSQLTQLDGLAGLTSVTTMRVMDNALLRSLPVFTRLDQASCGVCDASLQLERNPQLQTGPGLPLLSSAGFVSITDNAQLASLEGFASLRSVRSLSIEQNPSLSTLMLPELSQAESLRIRQNQTLDDAPLAPLRSLPGARVVKIVSNAPGASQLSPCPWPADGECDELSGDCAVGSDAVDCKGF